MTTAKKNKIIKENEFVEKPLSEYEFVPLEEVMGVFEKNVTLGSLIQNNRKCNDWTQEELAKKLNVNKQFLSGVERNIRSVGIEFIKKVADIFGHAPDYMIEIHFRDILRKHGLSNRMVQVCKIPNQKYKTLYKDKAS